MNYDASFQIRASSFLGALQHYPSALHQEQEVAASMVCGKVVVNLAVAGVDVRPFLPSDIDYVPFEMNRAFAQELGVEYCSPSKIPLPDGFADTVLIVATLHHMNNDERRQLYKEAWRILRPGGRLVIGDVQKGSPQARWLDEYVHNNNPLGHVATFFDEQDADLIRAEHFRVDVKTVEYPWLFDSRREMKDFVSRLFYLKNASGIDHALTEYLSAHDTFFDWKLMYFVSTKDSITSSPLQEEECSSQLQE